MPGVGFIKLMRSDKTLALMEAPNAFTLASVIAFRAQRTSAFNIHGLQPGEALLGDHDRYGMSEGQYRRAKKQLAKWGVAAFKSTSRGTIAKLADSEVYDINREPCDERRNTQTTSERHPCNEPATTTKNERRQEGQECNRGERGGTHGAFEQSFAGQRSAVGSTITM